MKWVHIKGTRMRKSNVVRVIRHKSQTRSLVKLIGLTLNFPVKSDVAIAEQDTFHSHKHKNKIEIPMFLKHKTKRHYSCAQGAVIT